MRQFKVAPEVERKRLLEGDWDVAEGAAFPEFARSRHVVEHFGLLPIGPVYGRRTTATRVLRAFCGGLLTGIIISGFIANCHLKEDG